MSVQLYGLNSGSCLNSPTDCESSSRDTSFMMLEPRSLRPFKTSEEYLYAMKEDLAEWLHTLYSFDITVENFFDRLETGVVLCRHANNVRKLALALNETGELRSHWGKSKRLKQKIPEFEVVYRAETCPGTFHARDNVSNFIFWCRALGVMDCLLFETEDLVTRKNEKSFILCLLEVARRGSKLGMLAPMLVQIEEEIDRDIAKTEKGNGGGSIGGSDTSSISGDSQTEETPPPFKQIITNDLKNLDEMVYDLVNRCSCPLQFPMVRVAEGKYRIGETKVLIYVRILRNHVMVRVGGGWDTLEHYLMKHDPCRCKTGHRTTLSSKLTIKPNQADSTNGNPEMAVTYERTPVMTFMPSSYSTPVKQSSAQMASPLISPSSPIRIRKASSTSSKQSDISSLSSGSSDKSVGDERSAKTLYASEAGTKADSGIDGSSDESNTKVMARRQARKLSDCGLLSPPGRKLSVGTVDSPDLRRKSVDRGLSLPQPPHKMVRSKSQCTDVEAFLTQRNSRPNPNYNRSWVCRNSRGVRPVLSTQTFTPPTNRRLNNGGVAFGRSVSPSPSRPTTARTAASSRRPTKNSSAKENEESVPVELDGKMKTLWPTNMSPFLVQMLQEAQLDSDDNVMKKMEEILENYRARVEAKQNKEKQLKKDENTDEMETLLPSVSVCGTLPKMAARKPHTRRNSQGGGSTPSKIPLPTYY